MPDPIEFYFDFSSPYGYLAAQRIDEIGDKHGRAVTWKPFLLGATFKITGSQPLMGIPMKGDYMQQDLPRSARLQGVPYRPPERFPFASIAACRAFYWLSDRDSALARGFAQALFAAAYGQGRDISTAEAVVEVAGDLAVDREALAAALQDPSVKARLRDEVDESVRRGVFGSPFVFVDGEPFWGHDRLDQVERWLETGGW